MQGLKIVLFGMISLVISLYAGGAAALVGQKSTTKDFEYSEKVKFYFVNSCSKDANEWVCRCVLEQMQHQYSEMEFYAINEKLENGESDLEFDAFVSRAVEHCDEEYESKKELESVENEGYVEGGSDGIGYGLGSLLGGGIATRAKGTIRVASAHDIDIGPNDGHRSAADIMKVVRQRTPGLRHIYNKYLKKQPGFVGKGTLRFTIAPGGDVITISIVSSSTGYSEFDNAVKNAVKHWTFSKVKSGNTTVTIPFTFSE